MTISQFGAAACTFVRFKPQRRAGFCYANALRALSGIDSGPKAAPPFVIASLTPEQYEQLIRLADPVNDHCHANQTYRPAIQFTRNGHIVAQRTWSVISDGESLNSFIRPAIAAANRFGVTIPWHEQLLASGSARGYALKFLTCLGAQNDSSRFYEELARATDVLFPCLCEVSAANPVLKYIDARIVPFLSRYVSSGTDELFNGLCTLALRVNLPEIDNILGALFDRWTLRFDVTSPVLQYDQNY
jgi:hypothetical protein